MPTGDSLSDSQQRTLSRATSTASRETGLRFSVFVGGVEGDARTYAERLLTALGTDSERGVLVLLAPQERRLEIVTGPEASRRIPNRSAALAALSMRSAFVGGDLVGGLTSGIRMLAETAGETQETTSAPHTPMAPSFPQPGGGH